MRIKNADHQLNDATRRVEFTGLLAGRISKLRDQVFVRGTKQIREFEIFIEQTVFVKVADKATQPFVGDFRLADFLGEIDVAENAAKRLMVRVLQTRKSLVQLVGDARVNIVQ